MHERLVLALDGSTGVCSAALLGSRRSGDAPEKPNSQGAVEGDREAGMRFAVLARRSEGDGRGQARVLLRLVDEMLEETSHRPEDVGAVVVGKGPGTFTGVRVTVATARALSLALAIPVVGVSTLGALAAGAAATAGRLSSTLRVDARPAAGPQRVEVIVPVVDARRGQLFHGFYRSTARAAQQGREGWARGQEFGVCDRGTLTDLLDLAETVIVGEEALRPEVLPPAAAFFSCDVAAEHLVIGQESLEEPGRLPEGRRLAGWLARSLGADAVASAGFPGDGILGGPGTPESVTPVYVRSPDADVHITRMKDPWANESRQR